MKQALFAFLIIFVSMSANASSEIDFLNNYASATKIKRTADAYEICTELLGLWPSDEYRQRLLAVGNAWSVNGEAAYMLLSTCQTNWELDYLNPLKAVQTKRSMEGTELGQYIAALNFIDTYQFLREKIALYMKVKTYSDPTVPPSPYEVLSGMASSERELDEVLQTQMRKVVSSLTLAGGGLALALHGSKGFKELPKISAKSIGGGIKKIVLVSLLAWIAGEVTDGLSWQLRAADLNRELKTARNNLNNPQVPRGVALDMFAKAVERLGYFYSYNLYLKESGKDANPYQADEACSANLRKFFTNQNVKIDSNSCQDAASLWLNASQFIARNYPNDPIAKAVSDRLMAKAKHTVWSFEETRAYLNIAPYSHP